VKTKLAGILAASIFSLPAWAGSGGGGAGNGGGNDGHGRGSTQASSTSTSTANGGAGGAGGSATGGTATGGAATGGSANGNTANVTVSLSTGGGTSDGTAGEAGSSAYNTKATVDYGGSYTVKSAPAVAAPSLTSTFSDTCMGSASFGLSIVGFGATGGTTMVDEACVRRLDSREFRAMGLNDVALALLCQSASNRKAVEATGRSCPSVGPAPTAAATNTRFPEQQYTDPFVRRRLGMEPLDTTPVNIPAPAATPVPEPAPAPTDVTIAAVQRSAVDVQSLQDVVTGEK
jgi:hypothetical protein